MDSLSLWTTFFCSCHYHLLHFNTHMFSCSTRNTHQKDLLLHAFDSKIWWLVCIRKIQERSALPLLSSVPQPDWTSSENYRGTENKKWAQETEDKKWAREKACLACVICEYLNIKHLQPSWKLRLSGCGTAGLWTFNLKCCRYRLMFARLTI